MKDSNHEEKHISKEDVIAFLAAYVLENNRLNFAELEDSDATPEVYAEFGVVKETAESVLSGVFDDVASYVRDYQSKPSAYYRAMLQRAESLEE